MLFIDILHLNITQISINYAKAQCENSAFIDALYG